MSAALALSMLHLSAQSADTPASIDPLLDGSALNDIWIHINAQDWQDLHATYQTNTYYPIDFEWNGVKARNAGIRVKGHTTRNPQKPSFRVDFNRYVTDQEFLGQTALVLNGSWADPTNLRDRISMDLFRLMGIPAPRTASVRLFVGADREYAGVYEVSEEVSSKFLNAHFGDHEGYLYQFSNITPDAWHFEDRGPGLDWYATLFSPQNHDSQSVANLYTPIQDLVHAVNDSSPSTLEQDLAPYFDLNAFMNELAVQNFVDQTDGLLGGQGMNNFYLYELPNTHFFTIIPWDQDQSFTQLDEAPGVGFDANVLAQKIWANPQLRDRYLSTLLEIGAAVGTPAATGASPGWLEQQALYEAAQIRDAVYRDPLTPFSSDDFESAVALMAAFGHQRDSYERAFVAQVAPEVMASSGTSRIRSLRVRTSR
jgi:spore coat protein CotH